MHLVKTIVILPTNSFIMINSNNFEIILKSKQYYTMTQSISDIISVTRKYFE